MQSQGMAVADAIRQIGVTEVTYYRWRKEYGGMRTDQLKHLKVLGKENTRLRRAVPDLILDSEACMPPPVRGACRTILTEATRGNY